MGEFLSAQLDFIYFFYGLAFILLGSLCFAIVRAGHEQSTWSMLGLFGVLHGLGEWLDLFALVVSDSNEFAIIRTAVMTTSFVFLCEFARRSAVHRGWKAPGIWIYIPGLVIVAAFGLYVDRLAADCAARYIFGFIGAAAVSFVFAWDGFRFPGPDRRFNLAIAAGFALYAVTAGLIVPKASFWPASAFNHHWFLETTDIPVQMVRGLLACWIAVVAWSIWEQKQAEDVSSPLYTRHLKSQYLLMIAAMGTILLAGWMLTEHLGTIYKRNVEAQSRGDLDLLSSRLDKETESIAGMAEALAGSPSVAGLLAGDGGDAGVRMLDLAVEASDADAGYVLDASGRLAAADGKAGAERALDFATLPFIKSALQGEPGRQFVYDRKSAVADYYASYPIGPNSQVADGVVVMRKSLADFEADLTRYDSAFFLVDPHGMVIMTNRPETRLRAMWPLSSAAKQELTRLYGPGAADPLLKHEVTSAEWMSFEGVRDYVRRQFVPGSKWSLVLAKPTEEIFASRVLGIAITLFGTVMTLVYLLGRERRMHDRVQLDKRIELQELATALQFRATTDPLTGLNNRLRFNEALSLETMRSQRYGTPLSLVLYDVDHFKRINDLYGHLVGDRVLIDLSRFVAGRIRTTDMLARWGGEEFVILLPNTTADMAWQLADQLRAAIAALPFGEVGTVTCSLGVAQYRGGEAGEAFIARADSALYSAKLAGRNRVAISPDRNASDAETAA